MPALPDPTLHIRHYVQTDDSVPRQFDAYYKAVDGPLAAGAFAIAASAALSAYTSMAGAMAGWLAGDSRYIGCTAHAYCTGGVVGVGKQLNFAGEEGGLEGDTCPDYVAAVISRYVIFEGPAGRGRVFIPAVAEINTDTSRLTTEGLEALQSIRAAMGGNITADPGDFGDDVIYEAAHWSPFRTIMDKVSDWVEQVTLATQRRRRLRPLQ